MLPKPDSSGFSPLVLLFGAVILITTAFISYNLFFSQSARINRQTDLAEKNKQQSRDDYFALIEEQKNRPKKTTSTEVLKKDKARGSKKLIFVLVKPSYLDESLISPLINTFKNPASGAFGQNLSINFINPFYKKQAEKFKINDFDLEITTAGIFSTDNITKIGDINYFWTKDPFGVVKLEDAFEEVLKDNNIIVPEGTKAVFLYFDDSFDGSTENPEGRFYEHKKFRSFAKDTSGRAYINVYRFDPSFSKTLVEIASHEILHLFGASDKYEENVNSKRVCDESGRGDPAKTPLLPQVTADIMCGYIEKENDQFVRGSLIEENLVINNLTAKEIGWIE